MYEGKFQKQVENRQPSDKAEAQEKIKAETLKNVIDIHKYEGIIQYTQIPNVESLLTKDIKAAGSWRWGSRGRMTKGRGGSFEIHLTSKNNEVPFLEWDKLSFSEQGQIAIIFDMSILEQNQIDIRPVQEDSNGSYVDPKIPYDQIRELCKIGYDHFVASGQVIPKEAIKGFVISPHAGHMERKKGAIDRLIKKGAPLIATNEEKIMEISHDQAIRLLFKRMNRQLEICPESAHFVPLYDYNGDVLWPDKINHDEINSRRIVPRKI